MKKIAWTVGKFVNEDGAGVGVETQTTRYLKRKRRRRGVGKTVESSDGSRDAEVPRGSRGAEAENEMQPLRQRGTLGKRMFTKVVTKIQRRWKRPWKKKEHFAMQAEREAFFCDWSLGDEPLFQGFFESGHASMLERIRRRRAQRCSLLEKAKE